MPRTKKYSLVLAEVAGHCMARIASDRGYEEMLCLSLQIEN